MRVREATGLHRHRPAAAVAVLPPGHRSRRLVAIAIAQHRRHCRARESEQLRMCPQGAPVRRERWSRPATYSYFSI